MEIRERNFHYKELAEMKKEEQKQYDSAGKNSPKIPHYSTPNVSNIKTPNIRMPKYY